MLLLALPPLRVGRIWNKGVVSPARFSLGMRSMSSGALGRPKEKSCSEVVKKRVSPGGPSSHPDRGVSRGCKGGRILEDKIREVKGAILESHSTEVEG